jgi:hypothetical protein
MGFFDSDYGQSSDDEEAEEEEEEEGIDVANAAVKSSVKVNRGNGTVFALNPLDFLNEKQECSFLNPIANRAICEERRNASDALDDREREKRKRVKATINGAAVRGLRTSVVVELGDGAAGNDKRRRGIARQQQQEKNNAKNSNETVKERERKKREKMQNGRDAKEWKSEGEMLLRQQYD